MRIGKRNGAGTSRSDTARAMTFMAWNWTKPGIRSFYETSRFGNFGRVWPPFTAGMAGKPKVGLGAFTFRPTRHALSRLTEHAMTLICSMLCESENWLGAGP